MTGSAHDELTRLAMALAADPTDPLLQRRFLDVLRDVDGLASEAQSAAVEALRRYAATDEYCVVAAELLARACARTGLTAPAMGMLEDVAFATRSRDRERASLLSDAILTAGRAAHDPTIGSWARLQRAIMFNQEDRFDEAEELFRDALRLTPDDPYALANYAVFLHEIRKNDVRAEVLFRRAVAVGATAWGHWQFAWFLWRQKRDELETQHHFDEAARLDGSHKYRHDRALFLRHVGALERAETEARALVSEDIGSLKHRLLLARVLWSAGKQEEAVRWFERATEQGAAGYAHLLFGKALRSINRFRQAREQLLRAQAAGLEPADKNYAENAIRELNASLYTD